MGTNVELRAAGFGFDGTLDQIVPLAPVLPEWVRAMIDPLGVEFIVFGQLRGGNDNTIWVCNGDCSCWFLIQDDMYLDRYSYVNEGGWCQGQHCPCHDLPARAVRPGSEADLSDIDFTAGGTA